MSSINPSRKAGEIERHHLNYVNALGERLKTGGEKWPCSVLPTLSKFEREVVLALHQQIDRSAEAVQAATPLSALAKRPDHLLTSPEKDLWSRAVVKIAVIDERTGFSLLAGMAPDTPQELLELLSRASVPHILMQEGLSPDDQARELLGHARTRLTNLLSHRSSLSQRLIARHLRDALWLIPSEHFREVPIVDPAFSDAARDKLMHHMEAKHWLLLEEVSLQRLVTYSTCQNRSVKEFLLRSSVDAVILHSRDDDLAWPLLAVEFDGPHHERPGNSVSDALKKALLEDAGIPLLRVSFREVDIKRWSQASSEERHEMSRYLDPMKRFVRWLAHEEADQWGYAQHDLRGRSEIVRIREELSAAMHGKRFDDLSFIEQEMLSLQEPLAGLELELGALRHHRDVSNEEMSRYWTLDGALADMKVDGNDIHDFELVEGSGNTWSATATYLGKNGKQSRLVTPSVSVNFPNVDRNRVVQMVHRYLVEMIAISVAELS